MENLNKDMFKSEVDKDVLRASVINEKLGISKFSWTKEFVFSNILNKNVALAGINKLVWEEPPFMNDLVLIDIDGEVVETLVNE